MNDPKLSICISTFNRSRFLAETLGTIIPQLRDEVELVVLDDKSTDDTQAVASAHAARCPRMRYVQQDTGAGFDEKYHRFGQLARGQYMWFFSDDDLLKPGAVSAVLDVINRDEAWLIILNAETRSTDFSIVLQPQRVKSAADVLYPNTPAGHDQAFHDLGDHVSYVGSVVVRRSIWNTREHPRQYFGTWFEYYMFVFQDPIPGPIYFISHPWIIIRLANSTWTERGFEIWMITFPTLVWSFPHFSEASKQHVIPREPWRNIPRLLISRATGHYRLADYRRILKPRYRTPFGRLLGWGIAIAPRRPLNFAARLYVRYVLGKGDGVTVYDLEHPTRN